jgi:hypothetical protein
MKEEGYVKTDGNRFTCAWPGCAATSDMPFTEGWHAYLDAVIPNMAEEGYLCPQHGLAYEACASNEPPPTATEQ